MSQQPLAKRLLVAEDDDTSFFILKTILMKENVTLTRAVNGLDVVAKFKEMERNVDLILMDIEMPEMNGLDAAQQIRRYEVERDLPPTMIVALTAHDTPDYHRRIFDARMNSIVQKPVRQAALLAAMRSALESKPMPMVTQATETEAIPDVDVRRALEDVKKRLWVDLKEYLQRIKSLVEAKSAEQLRILGHTIKGYGGHLLQPRITLLGRSIQNMAAAREFDAVQQHADELKEYVERVESEMALSKLSLGGDGAGDAAAPPRAPMGTPLMEAPPSPGHESDALLAAMSARFVQEVGDDIVKLDRALQAKDFTTVARLAHTLKGVGTKMGHAPVSDLGRAIQSEAIALNAEQVARLIGELQSYVDTLTGVDEHEVLAVPPELQRDLRRIDARSERVGAATADLRSALAASRVKDLSMYADQLQMAQDVANWPVVRSAAEGVRAAGAALQNDFLLGVAADLRAAADASDLSRTVSGVLPRAVLHRIPPQRALLVSVAAHR